MHRWKHQVAGYIAKWGNSARGFRHNLMTFFALGLVDTGVLFAFQKDFPRSHKAVKSNTEERNTRLFRTLIITKDNLVLDLQHPNFPQF